MTRDRRACAGCGAPLPSDFRGPRCGRCRAVRKRSKAAERARAYRARRGRPAPRPEPEPSPGPDPDLNDNPPLFVPTLPPIVPAPPVDSPSPAPAPLPPRSLVLPRDPATEAGLRPFDPATARARFEELDRRYGSLVLFGPESEREEWVELEWLLRSYADPSVPAGEKVRRLKEARRLNAKNVSDRTPTEGPPAREERPRPAPAPSYDEAALRSRAEAVLARRGRRELTWREWDFIEDVQRLLRLEGQRFVLPGAKERLLDRLRKTDAALD